MYFPGAIENHFSYRVTYQNISCRKTDIYLSLVWNEWMIKALRHTSSIVELKLHLLYIGLGDQR